MFSVPTEMTIEWSEVILMPGLALFFGLLVYLLGEFNAGVERRSAWWKWIGVLILAAGALFGFRYFNALISNSVEAVAYRDLTFQMGKRMVLAHWVAFLGPVACILGAVFLSWFRARKHRLEYGDL